ncbi:MAG: tetratricopeptide repeat protein [Marinifilaceae bacterium]
MESKLAMKSLLFVFILSVISLVSRADNTQLTQQAEQQYQTGDYAAALTTYQEIESSGVESTNLYYNMGNCLYKLGENTQAILYYERALKLDPTNKSAIYNLELAQRATVDKIHNIPEFFLLRWYQSARNLLSIDGWAYVASSLFIVFLVFVGMFIYSPSSRFKKMGFIGGFVVAGFMVWAMIIAHRQNAEYEARAYAIVTTPSVVVRGAPDGSGTELFVIHEGLKVRVVEELGTWYNIRLSDGNEGWIKKEDLTKI